MGNDPFVIFDGEVHRKSEVRISPFQSGLYYGEGCFETFRSYSGLFLHIEDHLSRLSDAASYLNFEPLIIERSQVTELLDLNDLKNEDAIIRIQLWREGKRGFRKSESDKYRYVISASAFEYEDKPYKLISSKSRVLPNQSLNRSFKLSNALNYSFAAHEAADAQADGALMMNIDGYVSETEIANIFWIKGENIYTPSNECDCIPGIIQSIILKLFQDTKQGKYQIEDIEQADAVFLTNSLREIVTVSSLDGIDFDGNNPLLHKIRSAFKSYKETYLH